MKKKPNLGTAVLASLMVVCAAQVAIAQVEWEMGLLAVAPGDPGKWDSSGHRLGEVIYDGSLYHMYLMGGQTTHPFDSPWAIGHWTSDTKDGPWVPDANPVLEPGAPGTWDAYTIYDIAVLYDGSEFRMWYGAAASFPGDIYVGYATNIDGWGAWEKHPDNPVDGLEPGAPGEWDDQGMGADTVLFDGALYRMWTTAMSSSGSWSWRIGYAESLDGLTWVKHPDPVLEGIEPWEDSLVYFADVIPHGSGVQMWYSGNDSGYTSIGYAISPDGLHWGRWQDNPVLIPMSPCVRLNSSAVIIEGKTAHGWFAHCEDIYYYSSPFELVSFDGFETGDTSIWSVVVP